MTASSKSNLTWFVPLNCFNTSLVIKGLYFGEKWWKFCYRLLIYIWNGSQLIIIQKMFHINFRCIGKTSTYYCNQKYSFQHAQCLSQNDSNSKTFAQSWLSFFLFARCKVLIWWSSSKRSIWNILYLHIPSVIHFRFLEAEHFKSASSPVRSGSLQ